MSDVQFWSDDLDMDLPKVIPGARELLGDLADVTLKTHCTDPTYGRLNHPCVWNGDRGTIAFFGLEFAQARILLDERRNNHLYDVEAFRDAWAHHYLMLVEGQPVWDTGYLYPLFEAIMWDLRKWSYDRADKAHHGVIAARESIKAAVEKLRAMGISA